MPVTLKLTFPAGRYHATPWGRHVNEGVPEWPPSPWRVLRALIATWRRKCPDLSESAVHQALEHFLEKPLFHLPPARSAHTRHYMPWEKKGPADRTLVFDTFVAIGRKDPVLVHWPNATLASGDRQTLSRLVENLSTLGRAEGWVQAELSENATADWNCAPSAEASSDQELVSVFCPDPATAFRDEHYPPPPDAKKLKKGLKPDEFLFDCPRWHLCLDTQIIHAQRWARVPGARWVSYARSADAFTGTISSIRQPPRCTGPNVARFLLDGAVLPLTTDTLRVAEAVRRAVMGRYQQLHHRRKYGQARKPYQEHFRSEVLSGKDAHGHYLPGHDHAYYLPTAEGDDLRRLTHVTVCARRGFGAEETAALTSLRQLRVGDLQIRSQLVGLGRPSDFRAELFGGRVGVNRVWVSATPYIGPAHVGQHGRNRYIRKALRAELRRWVTQHQAGVEIEAAELLADADANWNRRPRPFEFVRGRSRAGDDGYRRPFDTFRVTFSAPVEGPLCVGYACHFGLGLFLPSVGGDRTER